MTPGTPFCQVPDCGRPCPDLLPVCPACGARLRQALADVPGLAAELDVALMRQARLGTVGGRRAETPLPYGETASLAISTLRDTLQAWTRPLLPACGHRPGPRLADLARWLGERVDAIRGLPDGPGAVDEILAAIDFGRRAIDRRPDLLYCGPCGGAVDGRRCGSDLYAAAAAGTVQCGACGAVWDMWQLRAAMLRAAEDALGTATEIARAVTRLGRPVAAERIWQWAHRRRLAARGHREVGERRVPLYRVGDVLDLLAASEVAHNVHTMEDT